MTWGVHPPKPMMRIAYSFYFSKIYKFFPLFLFIFVCLASSLLWPWCIYASCFTHTGRPWLWLQSNVSSRNSTTIGLCWELVDFYSWLYEHCSLFRLQRTQKHSRQPISFKCMHGTWKMKLPSHRGFASDHAVKWEVPYKFIDTNDQPWNYEWFFNNIWRYIVFFFAVYLQPSHNKPVEAVVWPPSGTDGIAQAHGMHPGCSGRMEVAEDPVNIPSH